MGDGTQTLPRGRHGLTRAQVAGAQRQRILAGMVAAVGERGYAATAVADVLRAAGVSRSTFYELFTSKEDCFAAAFEAAAEDLLGEALAGAGPARRGADPLQRLDAGLRLYLDAIAGDPARARVLLVDAFAAGPDVTARRARALEHWVDTLARELGAAESEVVFVRAYVAAVSMLVTQRLLLDDPGSVPALREPALELARRVLLAHR